MKHLHYNRLGNRRHQQGLATVLVALVLLVASTLIVFFLARSTVTEQRIGGNEVRAKQAVAAAEAGVDRAVNHLDQNGVDGTFAGGQTLPGGASNQVAFCDADNPNHAGVCPEDNTPIACNAAATGASRAVLVSCGWSDDESARHMVTGLVGGSPALAGDIANPLTARGGVLSSGTMTVANYYGNATVRTGGAVDNAGAPLLFECDPALGDCSGSYSGPPPDENQYSSCSNKNAYRCVEPPATTLQWDTNLSNLDGDGYFNEFMGETPDFYRENVASQVVSENDFDAASAAGEVVWVTEGMDIKDTIGSRSDPVVLVVDGDVTFSANAEVYGVVYARGDLIGAGGAEIYGAMIVEGDVDGAGGNTMIYDPVTIGGAANLGQTGSVPGTWRDWPQ